MIHLKGEENMFFMHPEPAGLVEVMLQISEFVMIMNLHVKMPSCMKLEIKKKRQFYLPSKLYAVICHHREAAQESQPASSQALRR